MTVREMKELLHVTNEEVASVTGKHPVHVKQVLADVDIGDRSYLFDGFLRLAELRTAQLAAALRALAVYAEQTAKLSEGQLSGLWNTIDRCNQFIGGNGNGNDGVGAARTDASRTSTDESPAGVGGGG